MLKNPKNPVPENKWQGLKVINKQSEAFTLFY